MGEKPQTHDQFAKVFVLSEPKPTLTERHIQDGCVINAGRGLLDIEHVVAIAAQASDEDRIAALVGKEVHSLSPDATTISSLAK